MYYFLGVFQAKMFVTNLLEPLQKPLFPVLGPGFA